MSRLQEMKKAAIDLMVRWDGHIYVDQGQLDQIFRMNRLGYWADVSALERIKACVSFPLGDRHRDYEAAMQDLVLYHMVNQLIPMSPEQALKHVKLLDRLSDSMKPRAYAALNRLAWKVVADGGRFFNSPSGLDRAKMPEDDILSGPQINFAQYRGGGTDRAKFVISIVDGVGKLPQDRGGSYYLKGENRFSIDGDMLDWRTGGGTLRVTRAMVNNLHVPLSSANMRAALRYAEILTGQIFDGKSYDPDAALQRALNGVKGHKLANYGMPPTIEQRIVDGLKRAAGQPPLPGR